MVPRSNSTRHTGGAARGAHLSGVKPCRPRGGGHGKDPGRDFAIFPNDPPAGGGLLRGNPHLIHKKETGNETSELRGLRCRPPAAGCAGLIKPASLPGGERNSLPAWRSGQRGWRYATQTRSAGLQTGIAPRRGAKLPSPIPAWRRRQRGWRYATQTRSAGLQTGIAPRRGAKLPSPIPAWRRRQRGWRNVTHASPRRFAVPG